MAEVLTHETRQRNKDAARRSEEIKARIEEALLQLANKLTDPVSRDLAKSEFCRQAVRTAKREGLRSWRSGLTYTEYDGAMKSLQTLLGEKKTCTNGVIYTGSNVGWVLDIWEATLDYYFADRLLRYVESLREKEAVTVDTVAAAPSVEESLSSRVSDLEKFLVEIKNGKYSIPGVLVQIDRLLELG